jgi:hypothetical protein
MAYEIHECHMGSIWPLAGLALRVCDCARWEHQGCIRIKVVLFVVHPSCAHCSPVRPCCLETSQTVTYAAIPPGSRRTCCRTCRRRLACRPWCRLVAVSFSAGGYRRERCERTDVLSTRGGGLAEVGQWAVGGGARGAGDER